jgi:hypothetical protein
LDDTSLAESSGWRPLSAQRVKDWEEEVLSGHFGSTTLTKPSILFLPVFFLLYYYWHLGKPRLVVYAKKVVPFFAGVAVVMLPWSMYINHQK